MRRALIAAAILTAAAAAAYGPLTCKYDNSALSWRGKTRNTQLGTEFLCVCGTNQHSYWLATAACDR